MEQQKRWKKKPNRIHNDACCSWKRKARAVNNFYGHFEDDKLIRIDQFISLASRVAIVKRNRCNNGRCAMLLLLSLPFYDLMFSRNTSQWAQFMELDTQSVRVGCGAWRDSKVLNWNLISSFVCECCATLKAVNDSFLLILSRTSTRSFFRAMRIDNRTLSLRDHVWKMMLNVRFKEVFRHSITVINEVEVQKTLRSRKEWIIVDVAVDGAHKRQKV